jgi:hypothetical protein
MLFLHLLDIRILYKGEKFIVTAVALNNMTLEKKADTYKPRISISILIFLVSL